MGIQESLAHQEIGVEWLPQTGEEREMVRPASFDRHGMKKGAWSEDEDNKLRDFIHRFQNTKLKLPNWRLLPIAAGLKRCGKSCRLRWVNYLQPGLRKGNFTQYEEDLIIDLHNQHGNKWSAIAAEFPGRTDNDIKNYWHAHIQKRGKGKGGLTGGGVIATETSSQNISCITSDRINQDKLAAASSGVQENLESNADSNYNVAAEFQGTCGVDLPPWFSEEELYGMGLCQNYDMIMAYNSWNLGAEPLQEDDQMFHGIS